jgi:hypothetical protein
MVDARSTLSRMPTIRARRALPPRSLVLPATAALLVALAGCSDTPAIPEADPTPSASPLFASEEEALEAATAVYEEFLKAFDTALANPGAGTSDLTTVASERALQLAIEDVTTFESDGLRITGARALAGTKLQTVYPGPVTEIIFYACEDVEGVQLVDSAGTVLSSDERPDRATFEVVVHATESSTVVVDRGLWDGTSAC